MDFIGVLPDKFRRGITKLHGPHTYKDKQSGQTVRFEPEGQWRTPLEEALSTRYETDAHCVCYWAEGQEKMPMLRKMVLPELTASDIAVKQTAIMLDWDTEGHIPLTDELLGAFMSRFSAAVKALPELAEWYAMYSTANGMRVVYRPSKPPGVLDGERYIRSIIRMFKDKGMEFDESCSDWTRRYRLPYVVRDGIPSNPYIDYQRRTLDLSRIKKAHRKSPVFKRTFERRSGYPSSEESTKRLMAKNVATGKMVQTQFYKKAKRNLKESEWFDILFCEADFALESGRNDTIAAILGEITPILVRKAGAVDEDIFALLYGPVCQWEPDARKPDPHGFVWNFVQDVYGREVEKYNKEADRKADEEDKASDVLQSMAEGMSSWDDSEELDSEDEDVRAEYVRRHLFCCLQNIYIPMLADGTYSKAKLKDSSVIPYIQTSYMKDIIDVHKWTADGQKTFRTTKDIIDSHACVAQRGDFRPQMQSGGIIENKYAQEPQLVLPMYRRNAFLIGEYSPEVDGWLRAFFGKGYDDGCRWVAYAPDFEAGPIAALSIQGAPSVGKKLLIEGLAECLEDPWFVDAHSIAGMSKSQLLRSPFLLVNESWPNGSDSPPDYFKRHTGGDRILISEKFMPNTTCVNPMRLIMTANGYDLVYALTESRSVKPNDRKAIGDRLLHFDVDDKAKIYLENLGGRSFTSREGNRWIRGEMGEPSDFIIAKHFMWMYENRHSKWPRNDKDRYCVMGNCGVESEVSHRMFTRSSSVSTIIKAIIGITENMNRFKDYAQFHPQTLQLFVSEAGVAKYGTDILGSSLSDRDVMDGMQNLIMSDTPIEKDYKNYYEIDCASVLSFATSRGIDAPVLRGFVEGQKNKQKKA